MNGRSPFHSRARGLWLATALLVALATPATAGGPVRFGMNYGVHWCDLDGAAGRDFESVRGISAGATIEVPFRAFAIQTGLTYAVRGAAFKDTLTGRPFLPDLALEDNSLKISYLELPLLARWTAPVRGRVRPYLLGGGYAAVRIGSRYRFGVYSGTEPADPARVRRVDAGATVGAGVAMLEGRLLTEVRLTRGLTDVLDDRDGRFEIISLSLGLHL